MDEFNSLADDIGVGSTLGSLGDLVGQLGNTAQQLGYGRGQPQPVYVMAPAAPVASPISGMIDSKTLLIVGAVVVALILFK